MDGLIIGIVAAAVVFLAAWALRRRNRRRNLWPTEGIVEDLRRQSPQSAKLQEEEKFLSLAAGSDRGYTNLIKLAFLALLVLGAAKIFIRF